MLIRRTTSLLAATVALLAIPQGARAQSGIAEVTSEAGSHAVISYVRSGELDRAEAVAREGMRGSADDARLCAIEAAIVRAARNTSDRTLSEADIRHAIDDAIALARPADLPVVRELEAASPRAAPYARTIAHAVLARVDERLELHELVPFLETNDAEARDRSLAAITRRIAAAHARVLDGGELDPDEQVALCDPALVQALLARLADRAPESDGLPHDLAATASPSALHALALLDAPAIPPIEAAVRHGVPGADAALAAVCEVARARVHRHPRSTWASARGTLPSPATVALHCLGCGAPLPDGARFCPGCGASLGEAFCPRCGAPLVSGVCPRCGGILTQEAVRCTGCGEVLGAGDRFCPHCGLKRVEPQAASTGP